jgi:non-ribosomal peptide synthetase component F
MKALEQHRDYWSGQLSDAPPAPQLAWDKERPLVSSYVRQRVSTQIRVDTWRDIKRLAARLGATSQAVVLAAVKTLLYRYTGQTDLIVGTVLGTGSGAAHGDIAALRTRLAGQSTAQDLVLEVAASAREASEHLEMPFRAVLEMLGRQPGAQEDGLFNGAVVFQEPGQSSANLTCSYESMCAEHLTSCALVLRAREVDDGLTLSCEFDAELFESATVERLAGHLGNLLAGMAAEPHKTLDRLNLLGAAELRQLVAEWNATETEVPQGACIHRLIEAQAQKTLEAVAAVCRNQQLTYAELNARANQVASYLSKLGVGPEVLVGICADRSLELLVGLLGILKSGGAYLHLDPAYPLDRLAFMIEDAQAKMVLTQEHLVTALPSAMLLEPHAPAFAKLFTQCCGTANRSLIRVGATTLEFV